jgi:branched-chain amino acid transport system permease protein
VLIAEIIFSGLQIGVFYALMAVGLTVVFGILKVVNFAHGEFFMIGAYGYTMLIVKAGAPPLVALASAVVLTALVAVIVERLLLRPLYSGELRPGAMRDEYAIIVTFGLSLFLINLANQLMGPYPTKGPELVGGSRMEVLDMFFNPHRLAASAAAVSCSASWSGRSAPRSGASACRRWHRTDSAPPSPA